MFGPGRGPWLDESWRGWWGDEPPYHVPTFLLTHHPRPAVKMAGRAEFHFVTEAIHITPERGIAPAVGRDALLGGGLATVRQCLQPGRVRDTFGGPRISA